MAHDMLISASGNQLVTGELDRGHWVILGTDCCTLCDVASSMLSSLQMARPVRITQIDVMELPPEIYTQYYFRIPVLITHTSELNWPFNLVELIGRFDGESLAW